MRGRIDFPKLNEHFDVKHISHDLHKPGVSDEEVYEIAVSQRRIIVTLNTDDFRKLAGTKRDYGIIGISPHLIPPQLDNKLSAFVMKLKSGQLNGKFMALGSEAVLLKKDSEK